MRIYYTRGERGIWEPLETKTSMRKLLPQLTNFMVYRGVETGPLFRLKLVDKTLFAHSIAVRDMRYDAFGNRRKRKGLAKLLFKTICLGKCRIRKSLGMNTSVKFTGVVEADETFIGGKEKNKHKSKRTANTQGRSTAKKTAVLGMIERGGELRAIKSIDTSGKSIQPFIISNVAFGASLNTDEWLGYNGLKTIYKHQYINHGGGWGGKNVGIENTVHPTQKPVNLFREMIRTYTNPDAFVFDGFSGSGTCALACLEEGRNFIGCELNTEYYSFAIMRIEKLKSEPKLF